MNKNIVKIKYWLQKEITRNTVFPYFVIFLCAIGVLNALRFGVSNLDYYFVRNVTIEWQEQSFVESKEDYQKALNAISAATKLHPTNALYVDLTASVYEWGAVSGFADTTTLNSAKSSFIRATELRPLWPVTWANLAMIKWRLQEFDSEMLKYLKQADSLGPQKQEVHILFTTLGLTLYDVNHPFFIEIRETVVKRIMLGIENVNSREIVVQFIREEGHVDTVCRWTKSKNQYLRETFLKCKE